MGLKGLEHIRCEADRASQKLDARLGAATPGPQMDVASWILLTTLAGEVPKILPRITGLVWMKRDLDVAALFAHLLV